MSLFFTDSSCNFIKCRDLWGDQSHCATSMAIFCVANCVKFCDFLINSQVLRQTSRTPINFIIHEGTISDWSFGAKVEISLINCPSLKCISRLLATRSELIRFDDFQMEISKQHTELNTQLEDRGSSND